MKTFPLFLFAFLSYISFITKAQNLVPDSSFEIIRRMPDKENNSIMCTKNWNTPTKNAAGDYYHKGSVRHCGVPHNIFGMPEQGIQEKPDIDFPKSSGYKNKKKWVKLSAVYRAEGNESVLILGYFNYDKSKRYKGFAHYYIDDVSITPVENKKDSVAT